MKETITRLRVFIEESGQGGNWAGVHVSDQVLSDGEMQSCAETLGYPETAFVRLAEGSVPEIRFFTPVAEVELCGHATLATVACLKDQGIFQTGKYYLKAKLDFIAVEARDDGMFWMEQRAPVFGDLVSKDEAALALGIPIDCLVSEPQVVSTGLRDILIEVDTRETLLSLRSDDTLVKELSSKHQAIGIHVFTADCIDSRNTALCRNFAPLYGISEEPATGTSNAALACYWVEKRKVPERKSYSFVFEQGHFMNQPSKILVDLEMQNRKIAKVRVGGRVSLEGYE